MKWSWRYSNHEPTERAFFSFGNRLQNLQLSFRCVALFNANKSIRQKIVIVFLHFHFLALFLFSSFFLFAQNSEIKYLSGTGSDHTVNWQFYCTGGNNAGKWTTIAVPSCWELQGFGKYDYGFAKDSIRGKEKGLYKYNFTVPGSWKNKVVKLHFEGVMTDADVKVNGQPAGDIHQGAFYAFQYNISPLLKYGAENLLEVTVSKQSANSSVNEAERKGDFWIFGGIFRPVYLEAVPEEHIEHVAIDAKASGELKAQISAKGGDRITVQLFAANGILVGKKISETINAGKTFLKGNFPSPPLWSPESPTLYNAVFTLWRNGKAVHVVTKKIGFRTIEVRQRDGLYVNGVKVKLKGVNRHSFWPTSGRTTSKALSLEDVRLMKDMNMTAVRMSHYPPDGHFLDACDSLGLFVMDELAGWHGHYDTPTGTKLLNEMISHDVNHPSVIIWSNGNEGGHNFDLDPLFATYDLQGRPVVHPWQAFGGIDTQHYREYNYGIGNYEGGREIVMPTEFLHGWFDGGHGAGLEDYWEKMWHNPLSAGGFLWDFADEGVVRRDKGDSIDTDKFRGADGIVGPFHEKEGSYYAIKEIWSPVFVEEKELTNEFNGTINIENRYHFTSLSQCRFRWTLKRFREPAAARLKGSVPSPDLKPGERGVLILPLPNDWKTFDALYLSAVGPDNKEIFTWSFPIVSPAAVAANLYRINGTGKPTLQESDSVYTVSANGVSLRIHKQNGILLEARNTGGVFPLHNGPVVQEAVNNFAGFVHRYDGDTLLVASTFDRRKSYNTLQWKIYPSGIVQLQVRYFPSEYFTWFDGVNFSFPEKEIKAVAYMGNGPYRVWKNRIKGNAFGIWNKDYNNTETGEGWQYPEFKGYYSNLYWCKFKTTSQSFTVYTENEDLFLRLFTPDYKTDQWHNYEPIFPTGDVSFMQGIPAIGTKTQRAETTGPMGAKNIFYDYEKDPGRALQLTLYFDFRAEGAGEK